jgi:hypothetical protein
VSFVKLQAGCHAFYWGVASVWPLYPKGLIGGVLQRWLSFWKVLPSPQRKSGVTFGFLVTCLTKLGPSPPIAQFGRADSSRKSLGGYKPLPFKNLRMMEATVLGDLKFCIHFLVPFLRPVPQHNPVSEFYGQFLQPHGLIFSLTCTVKCGTLFRQVCAFPNHV